MSPPESTYFVRGDDGNDYGPVDLSELREWVQENRAGIGTKVRRDEPDALWQPWQAYPELIALLAEARAMGRVGAGTDPTMVLASMPRRMLAFLIDLILIYVPVLLIFLVILKLGRPDLYARLWASSETGDLSPPDFPAFYETMLNLLVFGAIALYSACFQAAHGKTPGKAIARLRVVNNEGEKPAFGAALVRGLVLSFSVSFFFLPLLYAFVNPQRRALHDLAAGTCVIEA